MVAGAATIIALFASSFTLRRKKRKDDYERLPEPRRLSAQDLAIIAASLIMTLSMVAIVLVTTNGLIETSGVDTGHMPEAQSPGQPQPRIGESSSLGEPQPGFARGMPRGRRGWLIVVAAVTLTATIILAHLAWKAQHARNAVPRLSEAKPLQPRDDRKMAAEPLELSIDTIDREPDPRRAVISCYRKFETVLREKGLPMPATYTPEEYLADILHRFPVTPTLLWVLTLLFEKARFSNHDVTADDKAAAIEALKKIRLDLIGPLCESTGNQASRE
jgi:hypothetical protein